MSYTNWETVLINGKYLQRIKHTSDNIKTHYCGSCNVTKNSYHKLGCREELSSCSRHKFIVECDCPIREGEAV